MADMKITTTREVEETETITVCDVCSVSTGDIVQIAINPTANTIERQEIVRFDDKSDEEIEHIAIRQLLAQGAGELRDKQSMGMGARRVRKRAGFEADHTADVCTGCLVDHFGIETEAASNGAEVTETVTQSDDQGQDTTDESSSGRRRSIVSSFLFAPLPYQCLVLVYGICILRTIVEYISAGSITSALGYATQTSLPIVILTVVVVLSYHLHNPD